MNRAFLQKLNLLLWAEDAQSCMEEPAVFHEHAGTEEREDFGRDFERLLKGTDPDAAVPLWESVYVSGTGRILDGHTAAVARCYAKEGLRTENASVPADYAGYETEFLLYLMDRYGDQEKTRAFAKEHFLVLLKGMFRLIGERCASDFFSELSAEAGCLAAEMERTKEPAEDLAAGTGSDMKKYPHFLPADENSRAEGRTRHIVSAGRGNCGGRCSFSVCVRDGCVLGMESGRAGDGTAAGGRETAGGAAAAGGTAADRSADAGGELRAALRPCARGLAYPETFLVSGRLRSPLLQTGERGSGNFRRISWRDAVSLTAEKISRITDEFGPGSRYVNYATGVSTALSPSRMARRLLAMSGGFLDHYNSYSTACIRTAAACMYGTNETGSSPDAMKKASLLILWGFNPVVTVHDPAIRDLLLFHRKKGTPVIAIDPHRSETVRAFATEHLAVRPGTDAALAAAMAFVIWGQHLEDAAFMDANCLGFDRAHMPEGYEQEPSYKDYVFGNSDHVPKSPEWAERITGVPAEQIRRAAVRYASAKPAAILTGWGPQRHANGEQTARAVMALPCLTGNVGIEGGNTGGCTDIPQHAKPSVPVPRNPYGRSIPSFLWTDAILRGTEMTEREDGVRGGRLDSNIRLIFNLAGNTLVNQHSDVNRTVRILRDRSACRFIICSDLFMTASARYADLVLPGTSMFEEEYLTSPWEMGNYLLYGSRCIPPLFESRPEFEWLCELAEELGIRGFSEGCGTPREWNRLLYDRARREEPELPDFAAFVSQGGYMYKNDPSFTAFRSQRESGGRMPYPTASGKIEIFSPALARMQLEDVPALPAYVPAFEGVSDEKRAAYPLQLVGWHTKRRTHSVHDRNAKMEKLEPHCLWIHPEDAAARGLSEGDMAEIRNDRGRVRMKVHVTDEIMKGVIGIPQGAWYTPDARETDIRGCVNVLTTARPTPLAKGNPQHSALAEVSRISG